MRSAPMSQEAVRKEQSLGMLRQHGDKFCPAHPSHRFLDIINALAMIGDGRSQGGKGRKMKDGNRRGHLCIYYLIVLEHSSPARMLRFIFSKTPWRCMALQGRAGGAFFPAVFCFSLLFFLWYLFFFPLSSGPVRSGPSCHCHAIHVTCLSSICPRIQHWYSTPCLRD